VWKKVINIVIVNILLITIALAGIQSYRVHSLTIANTSLSESVARYRSDLELARRTNDRYADTYRQAKDTNTELGECLSEHVSTLSQLREQLQTVRAIFDRMQSIIENMEDCGDIDIGDYSHTDSGGNN
jgi:uncharacterized protein YukE